MKRKERRTRHSNRPHAKNPLMTGNETQCRIDPTSAGMDEQARYANYRGQAEAIEAKFHRVVDSLEEVVRKGRKEDVINLMAWEIGDLRRAIVKVAANRKEAARDEIR